MELSNIEYDEFIRKLSDFKRTHNITNFTAFKEIFRNFSHSSKVDLHEWSEEEYLANAIGPKRGPLTAVVIITCIYCFIFLSGLFGNICTCLVIYKNKYMHTATNYYLFNLAVADLLMLVVGLPPEMYSIWEAYPWIFGEVFCIARTMIAEMTTNASILTITAFTIER